MPYLIRKHMDAAFRASLGNFSGDSLMVARVTHLSVRNSIVNSKAKKRVSK